MNNPDNYRPLASNYVWEKFCRQYHEEWYPEQRTCFRLMTEHGNVIATKQWEAWVLYAATARLLG